MANTKAEAPVALVTGGAGNLGRAVTRAFLDAGYRVFVPLHKTDAAGALDGLVRESGGRLHTHFLDLTTERGAEAAVQETMEWGGRIDAVAHLVGAWSGGVKLADTPPELWDRMLDLNLRSAWLVARAALPRMEAAGGGSIVFVSSQAARSGRARNGAYAVSKAALLVLAETIAEEYGESGIRANSVLPGTVDTPANRAAMPGASPDAWTSPESIASTILRLSSSESSENGAAISDFS